MVVDRPIILASASPRRREFFTLLGLPFEVFTASVDETPRPGEAPDVLVARLSAMKAAAVAQAFAPSGAHRASELAEGLENGLVVAADTTVVIDGEILGKPVDALHARRMLERLRGRAHMVYSAVTVVEMGSRRTAIHLSATTVWMREYTQAEIDAYVASGDPLDKAGAYAIQHAGFQPVARIEGCYSGVMGLPLGALADALAHFDFTLPVDVPTICRRRTGQPCCREA
ncbi:MAG: Maf family protein [Anaerolineae bacterium]